MPFVRGRKDCIPPMLSPGYMRHCKISLMHWRLLALAISESNLMRCVLKTTQHRRISHSKNVAVVSGHRHKEA